MTHTNVLLICTDHWPSALFGHRGHDTVLTPTLDQLARSGTIFRNCYSECPVCVPARRTLMTGTAPRVHGDRTMSKGRDPMRPDLPTMAQTFRDAGYQATAVGKLHVYPQRDRIGFDDVILSEEGRAQFGVTDDFEWHLAEAGYPGEYMGHGMGNNQYHTTTWHLPDEHHITNWATREMCKTIKRRDPTRPGFWYLSYVHPHPPLVPPQKYFDLYRDQAIPDPSWGRWAESVDAMPWPLRGLREGGDEVYNDSRAYSLAHQAFYALCTHIDHQLRLVIGTLREEGLLQDTVIMFTADHGDMLGDHGLWAKRLFYEGSANVPMILTTPGSDRVRGQTTSDRLVGLQDVMPTLLDLAGIDVPDTCTGQSMVGEQERSYIYGEFGEGNRATRMIRSDLHKLVYYAAGNRCQLFDMETDPKECVDRADDPAMADTLASLTQSLVSELYGTDTEWLDSGQLVGLPEPDLRRGPPDAGLAGQRGMHFPPPAGS